MVWAYIKKKKKHSTSSKKTLMECKPHQKNLCRIPLLLLGKRVSEGSLIKNKETETH